MRHRKRAKSYKEIFHSGKDLTKKIPVLGESRFQTTQQNFFGKILPIHAEWFGTCPPLTLEFFWIWKDLYFWTRALSEVRPPSAAALCDP